MYISINMYTRRSIYRDETSTLLTSICVAKDANTRFAKKKEEKSWKKGGIAKVLSCLGNIYLPGKQCAIATMRLAKMKTLKSGLFIMPLGWFWKLHSFFPRVYSLSGFFSFNLQQNCNTLFFNSFSHQSIVAQELFTKFRKRHDVQKNK